jgi:hypothetical protein
VKLKRQLSRNQQKPLLSNFLVDEDDVIIVDDDVTFGRNRQANQFGKLVHDKDQLSDHVKFRLWLARQLALKKYQETWG